MHLRNRTLPMVEMFSLQQLITEYLTAAKHVESQMKSTYGLDDIWLIRQLGKSGVISQCDGGYYNFHGLGCYFHLGYVKIDIDFGPAGRRVEGFDAWRLVRFAHETLKTMQFELEGVDEELSRMEACGELIHVSDWCSRLYFLPNPSRPLSNDSCPVGPTHAPLVSSPRGEWRRNNSALWTFRFLQFVLNPN